LTPKNLIKSLHYLFRRPNNILKRAFFIILSAQIILPKHKRKQANHNILDGVVKVKIQEVDTKIELYVDIKLLGC